MPGNSQAPNVVVVLVDDMGFGASSPYGGPCQMPTADRLAREGLTYSRFHVTALCSPTRQALLTGRNHHSVGMGATTEMATDQPGYSGFRPDAAATTAQVLHQAGYSTAAFGKWHQTPPSEVSPAGPFDRWPTGEGFDEFYGFMGAEMNHWYPQLFHGTTPVEPDQTPEDGYHLSQDLVEHAISWIQTQQTLAPDKPFYTYLAFGATHAPFHVASEWRDRYAGQFDHGWDRQRELTIQRQRELGVVPGDAELAPWADGVPHWDELDEDGRRVAARFMETYAGFAEHTDVQVGRLVDALGEAGVLENTLICYILGDNGASGEGGLEGTLREHLVGHGIADDVSAMVPRLDEFGDERTYGIYPVGWALAMNTPYQWTKQVASHYGGTRNGMIVRWGEGVGDPGAVRHQWHHVIDVLPTILDAAGVDAPSHLDGVAQMPLEGTSFAYTFDQPDADERHTTQYFEMVGNRGIYHQGWTAVTRHGTPWEMVPDNLRAFDDDVWELYDTTTDWTQARDISAEYPEKLRELQQLFIEEAKKHQVLPLDDRVTERENPEEAGRPDLMTGRTSITYRPGMGRFTEETTLNVKNRSHTVTAAIDTTGGASGVLIAQGGRFGGWSLYLDQGRLCYAYNCYGRELTTVAAESPLPTGAHTVGMVFDYAGGPPGSGATVSLHDGVERIASGRIAESTAYYFAFDESLNVGRDNGTPVTDAYPPLNNAFDGAIAWVQVQLTGAQSELSSDDVVRKRLAHQ